MKTVINILGLTLILTLLFTSCNDDEEESATFWYSFATFSETDANSNGFEFLLDSGGKIIPQGGISAPSDLDSGARVVVDYTIVSDSGTNEGRIVKAEIYAITEILTKGILQLTEQNADSIGNDMVHISEGNIWMTDNHLNIIFEYSGGNRIHYINLCKPIGEQTDSLGRQILLFKHNSNSDWGGYWLNNVVAFDMNSIKPENADSVQFVMMWPDYDYKNKQYEGTFYYQSNTLKVANVMPTINKLELGKVN